MKHTSLSTDGFLGIDEGSVWYDMRDADVFWLAQSSAKFNYLGSTPHKTYGAMKRALDKDVMALEATMEALEDKINSILDYDGTVDVGIENGVSLKWIWSMILREVYVPK
jgi:hypothetical protein